MTSHIHSQRSLEFQHRGKFFQTIVDQMKGIVILPPFIPFFFDDREKKVCFVSRVFCNDFSHTLLPLDAQLLSRLSSTIGQNAIFYVCLFEICHVHERHASCVKAEHEHITCEVQCRVRCQVQIL